MNDAIRDERGQTTRDALLAASADLIAEDGWGAATSRAITSRAGVNLALIRYHFGGKSQLLQATVEHSAAGLMETASQMEAADDLEGAVRQGLRFVEQMEHSAAMRVLFEATLNAREDPELQTLVVGKIRALRQMLQGKAPPQCTEDQARALGLALGALLDGAMLHRYVDPQTDLSSLAAGAMLLIRAV